MRILSSAGYKEEMKTIVLPALAPIHSSGIMPVEEAPEGEGIYYDRYETPNAKAAIVVSHGFSENAEKLKEVIYYMVESGYRVYAVDHRGHGRSFRQSHHPNLANIRAFDDYVEDLHRFVSLIVKTETKLPLFIYGHSMGGAIAASLIEKYPHEFKKAVLSSPMLKLLLPVPEWATVFISGLKILTGKGDTFGPGQRPYEGLEEFEASSSSNEARFNYYQKIKAARSEFQISATSFAWIHHSVRAIKKIRSKAACSKVCIPVLILRCREDALIDPAGPDEFAANTPKTVVLDFDECRHEIYNSDDDVLSRYYEEIFRFLAD